MVGGLAAATPVPTGLEQELGAIERPTNDAGQRCWRPHRCDGQCHDPITQRYDGRARVEDDAEPELVFEAVSQPDQVCGIARLNPSRGLDLDGDHVAAAGLEHQVHLAVATTIAHVRHSDLDRAEPKEGARLGDDEGLEEPAERVTVAQRGHAVDALMGVWSML